MRKPPPAVIGNVIVVGSGISDNGRTDMPSGEVRAFDVRSGKLLWTFDPLPGTRIGAANAWSLITPDPANNLVFVPTGSPSPDYYGGERKGDNHYANSVVALNARTGKVVWYFQTVHHDLWDYDVASQPALITAKGRPAVAVASKTGNLFILDRLTGKPIFGVEERPVPKSDVPGEESSPTQPFATSPPAAVPTASNPGAAKKGRKSGVPRPSPNSATTASSLRPACRARLSSQATSEAWPGEASPSTPPVQPSSSPTTA